MTKRLNTTEDTDQTKNDTENPMTCYETLSVIAQFSILIVTGVYAFFAFLQWRAIRATLDVTQKQKRPLIMVTPDNPEGRASDDGLIFSFQFPWSAQNVGDSTAFLTRLWVDVVVAIYPVLDKRPDYGSDERFADFIIPPNGKHSSLIIRKLTQSDIASIQPGEKCILFYGIVDYRDTLNTTYWTRFASYWWIQEGIGRYSPVGPPSYIEYT